VGTESAVAHSTEAAHSEERIVMDPTREVLKNLRAEVEGGEGRSMKGNTERNSRYIM
jgi:hypothetical protein